RRVRGVRAAGDRRDDDAAVLDLCGRLVRDHHGGAPVDGTAFLREARDGVRLGFLRPGERAVEAVPDLWQRYAVLRPPRPRDARLDVRELEVEQLRELRRRRAVDAEEALLLGVALDQVDLLAAATGDLEVAERLVVHREQRGRRAVLGAHVA